MTTYNAFQCPGLAKWPLTGLTSLQGLVRHNSQRTFQSVFFLVFFLTFIWASGQQIEHLILDKTTNNSGADTLTLTTRL
jgi:hypothetical protein